MEARFLGRKMSMPAVDKNELFSPIRAQKGSMRELKIDMKKIVPRERNQNMSQVVKERVGARN